MMKRYAMSTPGSQSQGDGLRKSSSYNLLGRQNGLETDSSDSSQGGTQLNSLAHSASMSPIKSFSASTNAMATPTKGTDSDEEQFAQFGNEDGNVFNGGNHVSSGSSLGPIVPWNNGFNGVREEKNLPVDAQNIYPSTACIFVANLTSIASDEELEAEVKEVFEIYGLAFVKLRRDARNMPYAFVQYTSDRDAQRAFENAQGIQISGRSCRVEKAKANSIFAVSKKSGDFISEMEASRLLGPLGQLSEVKPLDREIQKKLKLPQSVVVQYTLFDSARDPVKAFKDHQVYMVTSLEPGKATGAMTPARVSQEDINKRSVFIGNLPLDSSDEEIGELAIGCGQVLETKVRTRTYPATNAEVCFAFVEFAKEESVNDMITTYNGMELRGRRLRLEQRQSRNFMSSEEPVTPTPGRTRSQVAATPSSSRAATSMSWRARQTRQSEEDSAQTPSKASGSAYPSSGHVHADSRREHTYAGPSSNPMQQSSSTIDRTYGEPLGTPQKKLAATGTGHIQQSPNSTLTVEDQDALVRYLEQTSISAPSVELPRPTHQQHIRSAMPAGPVMPYGMGPYMMGPFSPFSPYHGVGLMQGPPMQSVPAPCYPTAYGYPDVHGYLQYPHHPPTATGMPMSRSDQTPPREQHARNHSEFNGAPDPREED